MTEHRSEHDSSFIDLQKHIIRAIQTGHVSEVCGYRPETFTLGWPVLYDPNTMKREDAIDSRNDCALSTNGVSLPVRGSSLFTLQGRRTTGEQLLLNVPAFIQAGNAFIVPIEVYHAVREMTSTGRHILIPISRFDQLFGPYPESAFAASVSAVIGHIGMHGSRIIEFGASSGNQLAVAAKYGAVSGLGLEMPGNGKEYTAVLAHDLGVMRIPHWNRFKIADLDILEYDGSENEHIRELWGENLGTVALPDTAIINIGPSYDILMDGELMSPHLVALQQAIALGVNRVIIGGLALVYVRNGINISYDTLSRIRQSDQTARDALREHFTNVTMYTLPNGIQCLVGQR